MTWHLKDRELEEKLIAIDPEFVDKLQIKEGCGNYGFYLDLGGCVYCGDVGVPKIQVYFVQEDLEEVPEYNPKAWNECQKVKPPYNVMMRVETHTGQGYKLFYNHLGDGDFWCDPNYLLMPKAFSDDVTRFRPWEG